MWNRRRTWLLLLALSCVALTTYFEPTHCVRGWLWGEAFFDGRPTSYWRSELDRWDVELAGFGRIGTVNTFTRTPTFHVRFQGPRILHGHDDDAIPVLRALLDDPAPKIRLLAQIGLKLDLEVPLRK